MLEKKIGLSTLYLRSENVHVYGQFFFSSKNSKKKHFCSKTYNIFVVVLTMLE